MDDFEEVRHLGRGAYGEVLLMRQTSTGLLCAVKKLGKAAMTAGEEAEHLAEVKALQALQHPCILRYYGSTELDESVSLVMEFADAGDLQHLLKAQADSGNLFEAAQLFALFSQLVIAVAHVHSNRVLHRDLKPSNVMLTSDGLLKLGDFGVAKVLAGTTVMDNMTCVGSPTYMAPEIVSGDPYGAACDVWSLGVILYEMASFQRPFEGRSLGELVMRISSGQFKDLREQIQEKPGGQLLEEAVRPFTATMLVPEPKHRGTMKEVVRLPTMQVFASSLKTSAIVVAALLRDLQEPAKSKGVEIDSAAVNDLIAELATSPKCGASASDASASGTSGKAVRSSLQSKALKQTVQEDSLMLSMTNDSDFHSSSSSSQRLGQPSGSKEISFQLTATSQLPAVDKNSRCSPTSLQRTEETAAHRTAQRTAQRTAVLAASQDQHALRDVLGDALGGGTAASLGGTAVTSATSAKRTASPGSIPVLNQSTSEVTKALAKRTAQRSAAGLAASQDQHALRDVLGDALGLDSGRRPSRLSETEASTVTRMQHSQSTGTVKEATTLTEEVGDGGIFMDQVSPAWKVSSRTSAASAPRDIPRAPSSSSSEANGEAAKGEPNPTRRRPPSRNEVHVVTEDANPTPSRRGEGRAPSLRAAGELHVAKTAVKGAHTQVSHHRSERPSSQPGAGFDADRSVTWPQSNMPPLQIFTSQKTGSDRSSSRPAGRPSTPESARLAKMEKEHARGKQRAGGLSIPFHDQPPGAPAPQPPKAVQERFSQHERQRREKIAELKAQTAPAR